MVPQPQGQEQGRNVGSKSTWLADGGGGVGFHLHSTPGVALQGGRCDGGISVVAVWQWGRTTVCWASLKAEAVGRAVKAAKVTSELRLPMEAEGRGAKYGDGKNWKPEG